MKKENLSKFYAKYRTFIFPTVVALSSLFLIIFIIYPQTKKLLDNQEAAKVLLRKSEILEIKASALENLNGEDLSRKVDLALQVYPGDREYGTILGLLQQVVAQSGFSIESISFSKSSAKVASADSFEVKMDLKGPKVLFETLLNNLENSPRLVKINSLDTSLSQSSQGVSAALSIDALYAAIPKTFGSIEASLPELTQKDEELITTLSRIIVTVPGSLSSSSSPRGKANPFE